MIFVLHLMHWNKTTPQLFNTAKYECHDFHAVSTKILQALPVYVHIKHETPKGFSDLTPG